jgi:hypothetical protein
MVEPAKAIPAKVSHLTAGMIVGTSALAAVDHIAAPARRDATVVWIVSRCIASSKAHEST